MSVIIPTVGLEYLRQGAEGLAIRIPKDDAIRAVLERTGPLLTTSANLPGQPPASTLAEAQAYFDGRVDFYAEGGDMTGRPPSTVIRIIDDAIEVLREGAVKIDENGRISE